MARGLKVGHAYVLITPNTQGFETSLRKFLTRMERRLRLEIKVRVSEDGLASSAAAAVEKARAAVDDITVDMDLDKHGLGQRVRAAITQAEALARDIDLGTDLDTQRLLTKLAATVEAAEKVAPPVTVGTDVDSDGLGLKIKAVVDKARSGLHDVKLNLDFEAPGSAEIKVIKAKIKALLGRTEHKIHAVMDTNVFQKAAQFSKALLSSTAAGIAGFMKLGTTVGAVGIAVGALVPQLTAMAQTVGSVTVAAAGLGTALAVPALTSAGLAIGTVVAAFKGMGEALAATNLDELNAQLAALTPEAANAARSMWDLKQSFDFSSIQENFWANISNIGDLAPIIDTLNSKMKGLAMDMGNATAGLVDFVSHGTGLSAVTTLIDGGSVAGGHLYNALARAVEGVIAIGAAATPIFEEMSAWINRVAGEWSDKIVASLADGSLEEKLNGWADTLKTTGEIFSQFGGQISGIFSGISRAAEGASTGGVAAFMASLSQLNTAVNSVSGQEALTGFFESTGRIASSISPIFGQIASIVGTQLYPAFAGFIENAAPGVLAFFEKLPQWIQPILDQMPELGAAVGDVLGSLDLTTIAESVGQLFGFLNTAALPVLQTLAPILDEAAIAVAGFVAGFQGFSILSTIFSVTGPWGIAITAIGLLVTGLVTAYRESQTFRSIVDGAISAVGDIITSFAATATEKIDMMKAAWEAVTTWFSGLPEFFSGLLETIKTKISDWVENLKSRFEELKTTASERVEALKVLAKGKFEDMKRTVINTVKTLVRNAVQKFLDLKTSASEKINALKGAVTRKFHEIKNDVFNAARALPGKVASGLSNLASAGREKFNALRGAIESKFKDIKNSVFRWAGEIPGKITSGIGSLWQAGWDALSGLWDGVKAGFDWVKGKISGLGNPLSSLFAASSSDASPIIRSTEVVARSISDMSNAVLRTASSTSAAVRTVTAVAARAARHSSDEMSRLAAAQATYSSAQRATMKQATMSIEPSTLSTRPAAVQPVGDYSIHIDRISTQSPQDLTRELEMLQFKQRIRTGAR